MDNDISKYTLESILLHFSKIIHWLIRVLVIEAVIILIVVATFLWYNSLPVEEYDGVTVENQNGNANYIGNDMNGDIHNGEYNESELQEKGN